MAGYILYNGFWNAEEPPAPVQALKAAAAARGVCLTALPNTAVTAEFTGKSGTAAVRAAPLAPGDYALFWDKDIRLARALEAVGVRLYNSAAAVEVCDDKAATHLALARRGLPMPRTLIAPMTYREFCAAGDDFLRLGGRELGFPLVVKECYGSFGGQVYLAHDEEELCRLAHGMGSTPFMLQRFVAAAAGTDLRLYVVGGRVVAAMRRHSDGDFRANIGHGGHGEAYTPTAEETALALACCETLGVDFAGVDLLTEEGRPLVCEVNSNAFMAGIQACTGVDVAGAIIEHVLAGQQAGG